MLNVLAVVGLMVATVFAASKVDPALNQVLKTGNTANAFISFEAGTSAILDSINTQNFQTRDEKISTIRQRLMENAAESQKNVIKALDAEGLEYESFWINNKIFIKGVSLNLVENLAKFPEISGIAEEEELHIDIPVAIDESVSKPSAENEWGVDLINAPAAWGLDGGNNGANVRVGVIDTGARVTHEALRSNYHGKNGWYDPYQKTPTPNDQNGHGTHTTGTICGQGGIGVAPGATWLACKGCSTFMCSEYALVSCGQFMLCPTDSQGNNPDCSQAPHLVSNSWGGGQGQTMYHDVVDTWKAAGIIPLFSNGNSGPSCGSANSPADYKHVIGVGSTTNKDSLSSFSSVGPSVYGEIKPDVSAPGSNVRSSYATSDTAYASLSGTSMACPHAAGVVALLKGRDLDLSFEEVKRHLTGGSDRHVTPTGRDCGGVSEATWPNNAFGHGRINALKSVLSLLQES